MSYWREGRDVEVVERIVEVGYARYPNRWAVSPKRAEELKAEWRVIEAAAPFKLADHADGRIEIWGSRP